MTVGDVLVREPPVLRFLRWPQRRSGPCSLAVGMALFALFAVACSNPSGPFGSLPDTVAIAPLVVFATVDGAEGEVVLHVENTSGEPVLLALGGCDVRVLIYRTGRSPNRVHDSRTGGCNDFLGHYPVDPGAQRTVTRRFASPGAFVGAAGEFVAEVLLSPVGHDPLRIRAPVR